MCEGTARTQPGRAGRGLTVTLMTFLHPGRKCVTQERLFPFQAFLSSLTLRTSERPGLSDKRVLRRAGTFPEWEEKSRPPKSV